MNLQPQLLCASSCTVLLICPFIYMLEISRLLPPGQGKGQRQVHDLPALKYDEFLRLTRYSSDLDIYMFCGLVGSEAQIRQYLPQIQSTKNVICQANQELHVYVIQSLPLTLALTRSQTQLCGQGTYNELFALSITAIGYVLRENQYRHACIDDLAEQQVVTTTQSVACSPYYFRRRLVCLTGIGLQMGEGNFNYHFHKQGLDLFYGAYVHP